MPKKIYTLKEIAELANVSRGTVDRVIHNRGIVSEKTYKKVNAILKKIDYTPNIAAQTLKKGTRFKIGILIPDNKVDVYWDTAITGITGIIKELGSIGVEVQLYIFNPFKEASFILNGNRLINDNCDGAVVAPVLYNESIDFFNKCKLHNITYCTFNTDIKESARICHVGQDLVKSGKTAASLMTKITKNTDEILIVHINEFFQNAKHLQEKEQGFFEYFQTNETTINRIKKLEIEDENKFEFLLTDYIEKNPQTKGIYVSTSKVFKVAEVIEAYGYDIRLIGYDLIERNIQYLENDLIDFIIFQNPRLQAINALNILVDYFAVKKKVKGTQHIPIEVAIKENYMDFLNT